MMQKLMQERKLWDLYSRKEEYSSSAMDQHGRFIGSYSSDDVFKPRVSEYLVENGLRPEYPGGRGFAVCLTHDIDMVFPPVLHSMKRFADSLLRLSARESVSYSCCALNRRRTYLKNFREIMALEDEYGAKSTFFFMALEKQDRCFNYQIDELKPELEEILSSGWEVGLHGGYDSYNDLGRISLEKKRLEAAVGEKVVGYRNHFLRFKVPETWELLSQAGFEYDSTFGYPDKAGFRNGMCHPYKPFNLSTNKEIGITEIPLIIMDGTLFDYMRLGHREAWELSKRLIDETARLNGVMTLLWHNTHMSGDYLRLYEKILSYCREKNAWMTCGREIMDNLQSK